MVNEEDGNVTLSIELDSNPGQDVTVILEYSGTASK